MEFVTERFEDTAVGRFILAARAFIAEVEREKIVERTTRGKTERARSGRIPQAFGIGCYGYVYNPATGRREIEPFQAVVVRRIFERYAESRSYSAVSNELNDAGITAFSGGRWYPITIRRMLTNEAYTGRTVYRRTKRVPVRAAGARRRSRVIEQPIDEQIEIPGATPAIIDLPLWQRVQEVLNDPERTNRRPVAKRHYMLRGRLRCGLCLSAMVGQTLTSKATPYPYYRCRHVYDRTSSRQCAGRYVPAEALERGICAEIRRVLTTPEVVLREQQQAAQRVLDPDELAALEAQLASLRKREGRLVRLYGYGEVDSDVVRTELLDMRRQREVLTEELETLARPEQSHVSVDETSLRRACAAVAEHLDHAGPEDYKRVLEALDISATATREEVTVEGTLPIEPPEFLINNLSLSPLNKHRHHDVHEVVVSDRAEHARARG
jgi:site-specific DNA recombinase